MKKTKVFISCGQRENTREVAIAKRISDALSNMGYDPFLAKEVQNLGALTGIIYKELETSEYFLFVDFKREKIIDDDELIKYRGSLFSHQELSIASYLEKECLVFREKGVALEGVQRFIISNPQEFVSEEELIRKIKNAVKVNWHTGWKNTLEITMADPLYQDALMIGVKKNSRWYHVAVKNNHYIKHAKNCFAFITNIHCGPEKHQRLRNAELHWAGYEMPAMTILPKDTREIDIFWLFLEGEDNRLYFNPFATSTYYTPWPIASRKESTNYHILTIKVVSDNFPPATESFSLVYDGDYRNISFTLQQK